MANNTVLASDNFASGSLAAGWSLMQGATAMCQVVVGSPNVTEPVGANTNTYGQVWTALGVLKNQISEAVIQNISDVNSFLLLRVRWQSNSVSGYDLEIKGGNASLYRWDNGTPTAALATATVTPTAGDVFSLVADGSSIVAYRNSTRLFYIADATYATGYPGYAQTSTTGVANSKVSAWTGYNLVQQSGVWQKQGVILPGIASDYAASGSGTFNGSQILFEGNAQILSGSVYKMWFSVGPYSNAGSNQLCGIYRRR